MKDFLQLMLKGIIISALLAWCFFAACGCSISKKISEKEIVHDTTIITVTNEVHDTLTKVKFVLQKDTAVGVAGNTVKDTIAADGLSPATNKAGKPVPVRYRKKLNGLEAWVTLLPDGSIEYGAQQDSFTIIINNLRYSYDSIGSVLMASRDSNKKIVHNSIKEKDKTVVKKRIPVWVWITIGGVVLVLLYCGWKKPFRK